MRKLFSLIMAMCLCTASFAVDPNPQPVINVPVYQYEYYSIRPMLPARPSAPMIRGLPVPDTLWVPRVEYQPYQYDGSRVWERRYSTPFRNLLFGRWRVDHYYRPPGSE